MSRRNEDPDLDHEGAAVPQQIVLSEKQTDLGTMEIGRQNSMELKKKQTPKRSSGGRQQMCILVVLIVVLALGLGLGLGLQQSSSKKKNKDDDDNAVAPTSNPTTFSPTTSDTIGVTSSMTISGLDATAATTLDKTVMRTAMSNLIDNVEVDDVSLELADTSTRRHLLGTSAQADFTVRVSAAVFGGDVSSLSSAVTSVASDSTTFVEEMTSEATAQGSSMDFSSFVVSDVTTTSLTKNPTMTPTKSPTMAPTVTQAPTVTSNVNVTTKFVSSSNLDNTGSSSRRRRLSLEEAGGLSSSARKLLASENNYATYAFASHQNITSYKAAIIDIALCTDLPEATEADSSQNMMDSQTYRDEFVASGMCQRLLGDSSQDECEYDNINYMTGLYKWEHNCLGDFLNDTQNDLANALNGGGIFKKYWDSLDNKIDLANASSLADFVLTKGVTPGVYKWGWVTFASAASITASVDLPDGRTLYTKSAATSSAYFEGDGVNRPSVIPADVDVFSAPAEESLFIVPAFKYPNTLSFELGSPIKLQIGDSYEMDLAFDMDGMIGAFANLTLPSTECMTDGYCGWLYYCTEAEAPMTTDNSNLTQGCCNPKRKGAGVCVDKDIVAATVVSLNSTYGAAWLVPPITITPVVHSVSTKVWVHTYEIDFDNSQNGKAYEPDWGTFYTDVDPWYMRLNVYFVLPSSQTSGPTSTDTVSTAMLQRVACPDFNYYHYDFRTYGGTERVLQVPGYSNLTLASRYTWFSNLGKDFTLLDSEGDTSTTTLNCATGYQCSICAFDVSLPLLTLNIDEIQYWDLRHTLSIDMNYSNFEQFADHWNHSVGYNATSTTQHNTSSAAVTSNHQQVHCNLPYGNGRSCPEGWSNGAAYGYKWMDWNMSISCRMGAEYLRGGDDCCDETGDRKCPRGSDFDDYFYDTSGNCVSGKGWICAGFSNECTNYKGVFEDQSYTLANVFELDTSSTSYSSTWVPTTAPSFAPTPAPTTTNTTNSTSSRRRLHSSELSH
eukprot:CAMPEP_0205911550 /NCGR_PEP_ID=MMETSP1325-20131115/5217_1 /ASSEMBLY_ACC=CAM_ASM_000708 /TAXON_ID=236786 /ORGANISM="Florenciella sp., Strain RCC1007" /LENGTH=1005 /DNA_ID=CAMNT_0053278095 /DNA_START=91 /DNA_END=3109 /DNA_ORIENTATION=+